LKVLSKGKPDWISRNRNLYTERYRIGILRVIERAARRLSPQMSRGLLYLASLKTQVKEVYVPTLLVEVLGLLNTI
jgi:hypothetical protein